MHSATRPPEKIGAPPGTLIHTGRRKMQIPRVYRLNYTAEQLDEVELPADAPESQLRAPSGITWLDVVGLHETGLMEQIGAAFHIPPLAQEDVLSTTQRPKLDQFDSQLFLTFRALKWDNQEHLLQSEQVSLWFGEDFVVSWQEQEPNDFLVIRQRLRNEGGRMRRGGTDYLAYTLLDVVVDNYFVTMEALGDWIEVLEEEILTNPSPTALSRIYQSKRELYFMRHAVWPLREVLIQLDRQTLPAITENSRPYWRDIYDHIVQIIDLIETFREVLAAMLDVYLSSVSNRTNEVMRVLTVIATIFIPLTFVTSLYGMNFEFMPELHWPAAYPVLLLLMLVITLMMLWYFRRKKWL